MKILIIRFSSIGDIVLTTPVVRCLKKQIPDCEIHYFTKPGFRSLLKFNPYIDRVITLDEPNLTHQLRAEKYDHIIDLHNNLRTWKYAALLGRRFHRFNKINLAKWLAVQKLANRLPDIHVVDRYMNTVSFLGIKNDEKGLDYFPDPATPEISGLPEAPFLVAAIGGQHETKKMPVAKWRELFNAVSCPIVLIGGKEDTEAGNQISSGFINAVNLCGKLSIDQSALVIKKSRLVVTHDTGMMHIASALKKTILAIWGNTIPEFGMYPYLPGEGSENFEVKNLGCRPCSKIGSDVCPNGHFLCMKNQNTNKMAESVNRFF
ncbi:MAG: glycosyl transferase [Bacteroidetes bacterium]|nr:glycosyl transferase [Bacteroidota bacterium]